MCAVVFGSTELWMNELISNALKYAFPGGRSGSTYVGLHARKYNRVELEVVDDGVGLPADVATSGVLTSVYPFP